jgi:hypothetical protein
VEERERERTFRKCAQLVPMLFDLLPQASSLELQLCPLLVLPPTDSLKLSFYCLQVSPGLLDLTQNEFVSPLCSVEVSPEPIKFLGQVLDPLA